MEEDNSAVYCCDGLRNDVSSAGERGIAILAYEVPEGVRFLLQSRGVAFEDEGKLRPFPIDVKINIASAGGVRFCPACGRKLQELVNESPEFFRDLANEHKKFIASMPGF